MINNIASDMLSKDFLLNVDMLECIRRGSAEILFASHDGVLLIDIPSQIYMIFTTNYQIAKRLLHSIPQNIDIIVAHDKFSYNLLKIKFNFKKTILCYNSVYIKKTHIEIKNPIVEIRFLTNKYTNIITKNYCKAEIVKDTYIENRLNANEMFGAFLNNNLCGFIGSHEEGSIGMLEVFPKYRKRGIGCALQIAATNYALANHRYPYGEIVEINTNSIALQRKLGFQLSSNKVYWLIK
ncbi:GNAT family N-acetyltransferase [Clostridium saccharobutylicum]|uniref:GCN5-like N-acetyltransferase n=1 Tax=Clostridium saccharobutylicum DSM 13864 TaxID=1345695 RepID=U5MUB8_CLOSA|nr:GNAT family N-acetyltransferase [Clostridium saccharobutylicum]AGX44123.1 GCN5-like N-acetyltransferase [Clostridium saccharobutylicum DSM 13864]AQR91413.1 FR47-like protein [Clostridium saccharobutylicum]AQS01317.1 FR47-like protein [Clostridium saccharobutylicum]AQS15300.1 FR47-like protein [Clostridium saccharobutylicum]MBA2905825.1 GNAT superfamily N-acetyltransferase [Clostridium saccharobutylicum]